MKHIVLLLVGHITGDNHTFVGWATPKKYNILQ